MKIEPSKNTNPLQKKGASQPLPPAHAPAPAHAATKPGKVSHDSSALSASAHAALGHDETPDNLRDFAHRAHNPHGALHAVEAGEQGLHAAVRVARVARGGRAVAALAEGSEVADHAAHHAGLMHRFEAGAGKAASRAASWLASAVGKLPGGAKVVNATRAVFGAPGRAAGAAARVTDAALEGSRLGSAVRLTGSAGRFLSAAGGRIPIVGSLVGGAIAVVDVKDAVKTLKDPHATTRDKVIAGSQGALSAASGALGVGALAVAGAVAVGLTAPVSVPLLLGAAAITGVGAFALSFFKKSSH